MEILVTKCLQGAVLSSLLWSLVVEKLLWKLGGQGIYSHDYTNSFVILTKGKYGYIVSKLIERTLNAVEEWRTYEGFFVNPEKIKLILFVRERDLRNLRKDC